MRITAVSLAAAAVWLALWNGAAVGSASRAHADRAMQAVVFVPVEGFPTSLLADVARHTQSRLGVRVEVAPAIPLSPAAFDGARKQYLADRLIASLPVRRAGSVVIALTTADLYTRLHDWKYTFAVRDSTSRAIVSIARMDDRFYGLSANRALLLSRVEKMVTKQVAILGRHMSLRSDPRSVLFDRILSLSDLDYMTEEFRPRRTSEKQAWLAQAGKRCTSAYRQAKAIADRSPTQTANDIRDLLVELLPLERRLTAQLMAIPRPRQDQRGIAQFLRAVRVTTVLDEGAMKTFQKNWSQQSFDRWARANTDVNFVAASFALNVGSVACFTTFVPAT
jgi:predicted Zn-dependent protease